MNQFIAAFGPILFLWCIPLLPMVWAGVATLVEGIARSFADREQRRPVRSAVRAEVRS